MQPKTLTDEELVREFLAKHSEDNYVTSEEEAAFNRLMIKMRRMQTLEAECKTLKLVPLEPTEEMLIAASKAMKKYIDGLPAEEKTSKEKNSKRQVKGYYVPTKLKHKLRYQAMIEASTLEIIWNCRCCEKNYSDKSHKTDCGYGPFCATCIREAQSLENDMCDYDNSFDETGKKSFYEVLKERPHPMTDKTKTSMTSDKIGESALDHAYNQGIDDAKSQADDMFEEDKRGVGCVYIGDVGEAIHKLKKEPRHD